MSDKHSKPGTDNTSTGDPTSCNAAEHAFALHPDPMFMTDMDGHILHANAAAKEFWRRMRHDHEASGQAMLFSGGRMEPAVRDRVLSCIQGGRPFNERLTVADAPGANRPAIAGGEWYPRPGEVTVDVNAFSLHDDASGRRCILFFVRDVTDNEIAENRSRLRAEGAEARAKISSLLASEHSLHQRFSDALETVLNLEQLSVQKKGGVFLLEPQDDRLRMFCHVGQFSAQFLEDEAEVMLGACLCGRAALSGEIIVSDNCYEDERHEHAWEGMPAHGHYIVPMMHGGHCVGVIFLYTDVYPSREQERIDALRQIGELFAESIAREREAEKVRAAHEQVARAEQRLELALEASSTGLWDWSVDNGQTYFNESWYRLLGYAPSELKTDVEAQRELIHPHDKESMLNAINRHFSGETSTYEHEHRMRHRDGGWLWVRDVGRIVEHDANGQPRRMLGVMLNIQALQDAIERAEASNEKLHEAQRRYELALEGTRDAIFDWYYDRNVIVFSPRWRELLQDPSFSLEQRHASLLDYVASRNVNEVRSRLHAFIEGRDSHFETECQLMDFDGNAVWVLLRAYALRNEDGKVIRMTGSAADISSLKLAEQELLRLVQQDQLTGLASRGRLMERLERALVRSKRNGLHCGILFFDFDRFKVVNDSLGHDVGDELLRNIAERLRENLRASDTAARFGGDEFVVLLEDLKDTATARLVADKLLDVCSEPYQIRSHSLVSTPSIGLVTTEMTSGSAGEMLRFADAAMYQAKRRGRAQVVEFDQQMFASQLERLSLEDELSTALATGQFRLVFQPIIDLESGAFIAAETLSRWHHPTRGAIPPDVFISIAEESNQIVPLGAWVIENTCRQLAEWRHEGIVDDDFVLSLNVSKVQLMTPGFQDFLLKRIDFYNLPRQAIKIEVTETTIVDNRSSIGEVLQDLRNASIRVMMDDFGTGHSSLSGLHTLPIDELKIDRSFINNTDGNTELIAITSSIVTLAEHLRLRTIGEGIETREHVALLQSMGCQYGQGYFWSPPVPADEFVKLLQEKKAATVPAPA